MGSEMCIRDSIIVDAEMGAPHEMPVSCRAVIRWPDTGPMGEFASPSLLPELRFFLSFFALELEKSPGAAFTL